MASVGEHNQLIKICYDGSKNLKHVLSSDQIYNMTMIEERFPLTKLPVCGTCERLGYWGVGMQGYCPKCGTITKSPITYSSYLASGYDVDATGATAKKVLNNRETMGSIILPDYGGMGQ